MRDNGDTICALATPRGQGGIAIVRVSGDAALPILKTAFVPARAARAFEPNRLMFGKCVDDSGETLDEVMAVYMRSPHSYTREDVIEIHCHGGDASARRILRRLRSLGARPAEPGEFTRRAFLNGRVSLADAEAVMSLIGATGEAAARASVRQLEGGVSGFVRSANERLLEQLARIEASTDFPDEIEEETAAKDVLSAVNDLIAELDARARPDAARLLREGASVVLSGKPNVGKSSLMNALIEQERAIVTAVPGTTRDTLTERLSLNGIAVELTDTAGQRATDDPVERIGVERARNAVRSADLNLLVLDGSRPLNEEDEALLRVADERTIVVLNKSDLPVVAALKDIAAPVFRVSAATGAGVDTLRGAMAERLATGAGDDAMTVERHIDLAGKAKTALLRAAETIRAGLPLDLAAIPSSGIKQV